jgi:hypothetical protein
MSVKIQTPVDEYARAWSCISGGETDYLGLADFLRGMKDRLYAAYQPSVGREQFWDRLSSWLGCAPTDDDRKLMLRFLPWLLFVGPAEIELLCQEAFGGPIRRWLIEQGGLRLTDPDLDKKIADLSKGTWFGSIAGADEGQFHRVNRITGQSFRPEFRQLAVLGSVQRIKQYMRSHNYKRICLFEDFVGTGCQMRDVMPLLLKLRAYPTLLCPLIVAPEGCRTGAEITSGGLVSHVDFEPVFPIPEGATLNRRVRADEPRLFQELRELLARTYPSVQGTRPTQTLYGELGFRSTGSLVVMYTNCPDNVPPLVHHSSETWTPIFPRNSREGNP